MIKGLYTQKCLMMKWGFFFTREEFPELDTHDDDVSGMLQQAIGRLVEEQCYGILYIPEGEYRIKNTVKIPPSVQLIGYGSKRPVFVLPEDAKGFDGGTEPEGGESDTDVYGWLSRGKVSILVYR